MSKRTHLTISMPEPCGVPWQDMRRVDEYRRHCASCAKIVTDFTAMSDAEIVSYLQANATQHPCGRFTQEQLNRPMQMLPEKTQKAVWWKAAVLLPLSLWSKYAFAQQPEISHHTHDTTAQVNANAADTLATVSLPETVKCMLPDSAKVPMICVQLPVSIDTLAPLWVKNELLNEIIVTGGVPMIQYDLHPRRDFIALNYTISIFYTPVYDSVVRARDSIYEALKVKLWGKNTVENTQPLPEPAQPELPEEEKIVGVEPPRQARIVKS